MKENIISRSNIFFQQKYNVNVPKYIIHKQSVINL